MHKLKKTKRVSKVDIGLNLCLNKPTAEISFKRVKTNLTNLIVKRSNESISLAFTDAELIKLHSKIKLWFGY